MIPRFSIKLNFAAAAFGVLLWAVAYGGDWIVDVNSGCKVWNPNPSSGESATWTGPCHDGVAAGKGMLNWSKGGVKYERDEGEWRGGRQAGQGSQTWTGGQYKGNLADGLPYGQGMLTIGKTQYQGAFLNGKPNGKAY